MKKFYESPVVELTGFSAEDVITTSAITVIEAEKVTATDFEAALNAKYDGVTGYVINAGDNTVSQAYTW